MSGGNYQWNTGTAAIAAYITTPPMDAGDPGADKTITAVEMTGYSQATVGGGVWAASAGEDFPLTDLQNGTNPDSGVLSFLQGSNVRPSYRQHCNVARARLFAVRVNLDWTGSGTLARLDEMVIVGNITERRY